MKLIGKVYKEHIQDGQELDVNPVYHTAKSCLINLCRAGVPEALVLNQEIKFSDSVATGLAVQKGIAILQESRYNFLNENIIKSGCKNILDIGCGYSPRGLLLSAMGFNYVGGDLEPVVQKMGPLMARLTKGFPGTASYLCLDATNPQDIVEAAKGFDGPVCIITEGVMMYFDANQLAEFLEGIKAVLKAYEGCVLTPDFAMNALTQASVSAASAKPVGWFVQEAAISVVNGYTTSTGADMDSKAWFAVVSDEVPFMYYTSNGFNVERIPICTDTTEIGSARLLSDSKAKKLSDSLREVYGWKITL